MRGRERALRDALRAEAGEDGGARERAWQVVRAAYAEHEPARRRRPWAAAVAALMLSAVAAAGVAAASAPDSGVGRWVRDVLSASRATAPAPGSDAFPAAAGSWSNPVPARGPSRATAPSGGSAGTPARRGRPRVAS